MSDSQERFYEKSLRQLEKVESAQQKAKDIKEVATLTIVAIILIFFLFFISPGLLLSGLVVMFARVKLDVPPWIGIGFLTSIPIFTVFYYKTGKRFKRALGYYSILCDLPPVDVPIKSGSPG